MMMSNAFAALAAACLLLVSSSTHANAAASPRQEVRSLADSNESGGKALVTVSSIADAVDADSSAPKLLDATPGAALAATAEGEPLSALGSSGNSNAAHPGLRGLAVPADCPPTKPPTRPKPTMTGPVVGKGKGGSPSKSKVSKAKVSKAKVSKAKVSKSKTMDSGKGKGQVASKGSKGGRPKKSNKVKSKTSKGGCGGGGCSKSKSVNPGKGKGQVKAAKKSAKGPKSSKAKSPKAKSSKAKPTKGCTHCPPTKPTQPKPTPPKPTKPTPKCTGTPATTAPTANIEMPPDDTCERQCMQWVYDNCVVLDELGDLAEDHCIVPFPFDDDLFGRSLASAAAGGEDVMAAPATTATVQEKIDYHRRMAHVYQQVLSLID